MASMHCKCLACNLEFDSPIQAVVVCARCDRMYSYRPHTHVWYFDRLLEVKGNVTTLLQSVDVQTFFNVRQDYLYASLNPKPKSLEAL